MKIFLVALAFLLIVVNVSLAQLTEDEQNEILRAHNTFRGQVDPVATNMEQMVSQKWMQILSLYFWSLVLHPLPPSLVHCFNFTGMG